MSLKAFHVVFVALSAALSAGFGLRAINGYVDGQCTGVVTVAIVAGSFAVAGALACYGVWFLRKLKHVSVL